MSKYGCAIVGSVTKDKNTDCFGNVVERTGGAVLFAGAQARALGGRPAAIVKCAEKDADRLNDFPLPKEDIFYVPSSKSTNMENVYLSADKERRICRCASAADPFQISEIPDLDAEIYYLAGLVYGDFNSEIIKTLAKRFPVAFDAQAALRRVADDGSVYFADWEEKREIIPYITYLKADAAEAEILTGRSDRREAARLLRAWGAKEIVITHGSEVLAYDGEDFFARPIKARNLSGRTGRGDSTFAAYLNERISRAAPEALLIAAAAVSLKMETPGPFRGTRADVENYIDEFYCDFK